MVFQKITEHTPDFDQISRLLICNVLCHLIDTWYSLILLSNSPVNVIIT